MKIEGRKHTVLSTDYFKPTEVRSLVLLPENDEESKLIDEYLSAKIPSKITGTIELADGYGQHYIELKVE